MDYSATAIKNKITNSIIRQAREKVREYLDSLITYTEHQEYQFYMIDYNLAHHACEYLTELGYINVRSTTLDIDEGCHVYFQFP